MSDDSVSAQLVVDTIDGNEPIRTFLCECICSRLLCYVANKTNRSVFFEGSFSELIGLYCLRKHGR